jgi:hypothetical protein
MRCSWLWPLPCNSNTGSKEKRVKKTHGGGGGCGWLWCCKPQGAVKYSTHHPGHSEDECHLKHLWQGEGGSASGARNRA